MRDIYRLIILAMIAIFSGCRSPMGLPWGVHKRALWNLRNETISYVIRSIRYEGNIEEIARQKRLYVMSNSTMIQEILDIQSFSGITTAPEEKTRAMLGEFFPHILQEIEFLSSNEGLDRKLLFGFASARLQIGGCSVYLTGDPPLLVRNYDWSPTFSENLVVSYRYHSNSLHDSIGMSEGIIGRISGINRAGLTIAIAAVNSSKIYASMYGLSMPVIVRGVLDTATTTKEAIHLLQKIPHAAPYNYGIVDASGDFAVVEATPDNIIIRRDMEAKGYLSAVNHFVLQSNKKNNVYVFANSKKRYRSLGRIRDNNIDKDNISLFNYFGDPVNGPGMQMYSMLFGTLWTVIYNPSKKQMHLRAGLDGEQEILSFDKKGTLELKAQLQDHPGDL